MMDNMHERTQALLELMDLHRLKAGDVGLLLGRSPATVRIWRVADTKRPIPPHALELLRVRLSARHEAGANDDQAEGGPVIDGRDDKAAA